MIVAADDLGMSDDVNSAIAEAFAQGLVTSTSIMANMPAFDAACALAAHAGFGDRVGVHLVLTEGTPLTEPVRSCRRFCDEQGQFTMWRRDDSVLWLRPAERAALRAELDAQIAKCRDSGLRPAHLDSHQHVHTKRALGRLVVDLARAHGIPRVRLAHNCGPRLRGVNRLSKASYNRRLRRAGLAGSRWLGGFDDYRFLAANGVPSMELDGFELVTHPVLRDGMLVDVSAPDRPFAEVLPR